MELFIQDSINIKQYRMYTLGRKIFTFDLDIRFETYQNKWYYGIIFIFPDEGDGIFSKDAHYDIIHHYHMDWERFIINNKDGYLDLPFHEGTYRFLPDSIKVIEL